jgi:hypothetical protein
MFRECTPEEMEELRGKQERQRGQRYRAIYELLGLKVTASKDKTLEARGPAVSGVWLSATNSPQSGSLSRVRV